MRVAWNTSINELPLQAMCTGLSEDEAERIILQKLHDSIKVSPLRQFHWFAHIVRRA